MLIAPSGVLIPLENRKKLRALDIACAAGGLGISTYSKIARRMPELEVSYRGFDASNRGNAFSCRSENFSAEVQQNTLLQEQLGKEPSDHYQHVHLHGLRTGIFKSDFERAISDINRIISRGGYFFFSMDNCACQVIDNGQERSGMFYAIESIRNDFQLILSEYQHSCLEGNQAFEIRAAAGERIVMPEAEGLIKAFGIGRNWDGDITNHEIIALFKLFSAQATDSNYFAIGKKREA